MKALVFILALFSTGLLSTASGQTTSLPKSADTPGSTASPSQPGVWMFAYFRQRYDSRVEIDAQGHPYNVPLAEPMRVEQLHLALSHDGRHWHPLNGNRPVWEHQLRDPFLQRGPDGWWRLVATGRGSPASANGTASRGPLFLFAVSRDLLTWEGVRSLPLMQGVHDETGRPARNVWAPEWFFDEKTQDYVLLWASSFEDTGWKRSQIWFARTKDWQTFTPAKVLFAPAYSAIDPTLLEHDGTYFLFHKEEEFSGTTGERRAIRVATSDRLEGSYQVQEGPLNCGQIAPTITEGPSVIPDPLRPGGWLLLYDYCMTDRYGTSFSPDLVHWSVEEAVSFPPAARHGSFAHLTAAEAARLLAAYPAEDNKGTNTVDENTNTPSIQATHTP